MTGRIKTAVEELGRGQQVMVEFELEYDADPGEPRTWDYPGSPAHIELTGVRVTKFESREVTVTRKERPEWFELLDRIVDDYVQDLYDDYADEVAEHLHERELAYENF